MAQRERSEQQYSYFGLQAAWGVTKHLGGRAATDRLVEVCGITPSSRVLEIGCGTGITACYLATELGCEVIGIDLNQGMAAWARERALRRQVSDRVSFAVADAQQLPFADRSFDAVISESVTSFVPDKHRAIAEYLRVLVPGGRVGLTEASWVRNPPPPELVHFLTRAMDGAVFLPPDGWLALLEHAGAVDRHGETFHLTIGNQVMGDLGREGWRDVAERVRAMGSFVARYATDAELRRYARTLIPSRRTMRDLFRYYGFGIYSGRRTA